MRLKIQQNYRLRRLYDILSYELSGAALFGLSFFYGFAMYLLGAAMLIFIPYLLYVLFAEKCYGWAVALVIFVIIPGIISVFFLADTTWSFLLSYLVIGAFFLYCHLLKITLPSYMD